MINFWKFHWMIIPYFLGFFYRICCKQVGFLESKHHRAAFKKTRPNVNTNDEEQRDITLGAGSMNLRS